MLTVEALQYPIGRYVPPTNIQPADYHAWLADFRQLPVDLAAVTHQIVHEALLTTPYRPGGWTAQQVIVHLADSHLHAYQRFKLALVEDNPSVQPYDEDQWVRQPDQDADIAISLQLLQALHHKIDALLSPLSPTQWQRTFYHLGTQKSVTLAHNIGLYTWHGRHHLAHLQLVLASKTSIQ